MSPAKLNITLQSNFVRTELETGERMLAQAVIQKNLHEDESAAESLTMARVALSGAVRHLTIAKLPSGETKDLRQNIRELRRGIETFERGANLIA